MSIAIATPEVSMPESMKSLPVARGFVVPWFVEWLDGVPEFRAMNMLKLQRAIRERLCWICGSVMRGINNPFVVGPMCVVNRISAEPPCHVDCARYSAQVCPFLSRSHMFRRDASDLLEKCGEEMHMSPYNNPRNPGGAALYFTRGWQLIHVREGSGVLFEMGPAVAVEWYTQGHRASRAEAEAILDAGIEVLRDEAQHDGREEIVWMEDKIKKARALLPKG